MRINKKNGRTTVQLTRHEIRACEMAEDIRQTIRALGYTGPLATFNEAGELEFANMRKFNPWLPPTIEEPAKESDEAVLETLEFIESKKEVRSVPPKRRTVEETDSPPSEKAGA